MIMKHTVIPRKTSSGRDLEEAGVKEPVDETVVVAVIPEDTKYVQEMHFQKNSAFPAIH
jgi:hypothetical protein